MKKNKKLQRQIMKVDREIENLAAYYFQDHELTYPIQSIDMAVDTALQHPNTDELIPGESLDLLRTDIKQVKELVTLIMRRTELTRQIYLSGLNLTND